MKLTHFVILIYGLVTIAGGIVGFFKTDSFISLLIYVLLGCAVIFSSNLIGSGNFKGVLLSLVISFALGIYSGLRYTKYDMVVPAGILTIVSMLALGFSVYAVTNKDQYTNQGKP